MSAATLTPKIAPVDNYVVIDTESNDWAASGGIVIQLGWCVVTNGEVADSGHLNVKPAPWLHITEGAYKTHGISFEKLAATGEDPAVVFEDVLLKRLLRFSMEKNYWLVGHNITFDMAAIANTVKEFSLAPIDFDGLPIIDTAALVKATQIPDCYRRKGELITDFYKRILGKRIKGLKYNLDFAMDKYAIDHTRGKHNAEEDCVCTHRVLKALNRLNTTQTILWPERD